MVQRFTESARRREVTMVPCGRLVMVAAAAAAFLAGQVTVAQETRPPDNAATQVTVGRGTINVPAGPWTVKPSSEGESAVLARERKYRPGTKFAIPTYKGVVYIRVFRNKLPPDAPATDPAGVAADFLDREVQTMKEELKPSHLGAYDLDHVARGTRVIGGKQLHFLKYRVLTWSWGQPSALYLWFPDDFNVSREFYGFLISERVALEGIGAVTHKDIEPVIESFRLETQPVSDSRTAETVSGEDTETLARLRALAEVGDVHSARILGHLYLNGTGAPKDLAESAKWFRKAAEQGDADAQHNLGVMCAEGEGVPQSYAEAERWWRMAAEQDYALSQHALGTLHDVGTGVHEDNAQALTWYLKAAEQGLPEAQNNLAAMYQEGRGVAQDYVQSYKWCRLAAAGLPEVGRSCDLLAKQMNPAQLAEAERLVAEWKSVRR